MCWKIDKFAEQVCTRTGLIFYLRVNDNQALQWPDDIVFRLHRSRAQVTFKVLLRHIVIAREKVKFSVRDVTGKTLAPCSGEQGTQLGVLRVAGSTDRP